MSSSREEERNAGKSHTEASGRVGNALFFDLSFFDKGISFIFIHYSIHLCFIYFSACFVFEIFSKQLGKKIGDNQGVLLPRMCRQMWSLYIREYDARVKGSQVYLQLQKYGKFSKTRLNKRRNRGL